MTPQPEPPITEEHVLAALTNQQAEPRAPDCRDDLADAVDVYRAAGRAALHTQLHDPWLQAHLHVRDWSSAEASAAHNLAPALDRLDADGVACTWWYLRKHPTWRLRCRPSPGVPRREAAQALGDLLNDLTARGHLHEWRWGHYEPEALAFGGNDTMDAVHDFFHADSVGVLAHTRQPDTTTQPGRRELSVLLCTAMLRTAHLDPLERADVFDRVAASRPIPEPSATRLTGMAASLHQLMRLDTTAGSELFAPGRPLAVATEWTAAFRTIGWRLADADRDGNLHHGLRQVLATIIRHHWNRLGLPDHTQGVLARACRYAAMVPDRQSPDAPRQH